MRIVPIALITILTVGAVSCSSSSPSKEAAVQPASSHEAVFLQNIEKAMTLVNDKKLGYTVQIRPDKGYLGSGNFILQMIESDQTATPIGMIAVLGATPGEEAWKVQDPEAIAQAIELAAMQTKQVAGVEGVFVNESGNRFDTRGLKNHTFAVDDQGRMVIDGCFITDGTEFILLDWIRSTHTVRLVSADDNTIYFVDEPFSVRPDRKGMQIVCIGVDCNGQKCYTFARPILAQDWNQEMLAQMQDWPAI